jgi:hypothetical protein
MSRLLACLGCIALASCAAPGRPDALTNIHYGEAKLIATLADARINESSGLAASPVHKNIFWTHNDSGDGPVLYAFDKIGRSRGTVRLKGIVARDWEDMAACRVGGQPLLLVADVGDNQLKRRTYQLHLIAEPTPGPKPTTLVVTPQATLQFVYADGPQNCEAMGVDTGSQTVFLINKPLGKKPATVYQLPLSLQTPHAPLTARPIGQVDIQMPTAMDISPDGRKMVVIGYGPKILLWYRATASETWAEALRRPPRHIADAPFRLQGESICYGPRGINLYLGSEKRPAPLWRITPIDNAKPPAGRPGVGVKNSSK